ncbi:MAG: hypothetical protein DLM58_07520 [Pseudonocardiales bacterium]|nr:MAG: hypothetical protein DLM58_07520 [Pseudonocardiales bacterium]
MAVNASKSRDRFVNPYSFVPFPRLVERREPPGHDRAHTAGDAALYSGRITVEWQLLTPLLLPSSWSDERWLDSAGRLSLPGSAMKGALRSLHEAMFGGCLRIFDGDFVPGYRDPAQGRAVSDGWRLAVVTDSNAGRPTKVRLCDGDPIWVDATSLLDAYRKAGLDLPTSGDTFEIEGGAIEGTVGRKEMPRVRSVNDIAAGGERRDDAGRSVVLITDAAVRRLRREPRGCFWAVGTLTDQMRDVGSEPARRFWQACEGSNDRRELLRNTERWADKPWAVKVPWQQAGRDVVLGQRFGATGYLHPGEAIWIKLTDGIVEELSLAQIWRHSGKGALKTRIPPSFVPCLTDAAEQAKGLCLSCEVFGAADTSGVDSGKGRNVGYAGHVRIGSACSEGVVKPVPVRLAPLGMPRPGAGIFYLRDPGARPNLEVNESPTEWEGSPARQVRGRKYYWHGDPDAQAEYWQAELGTRASVRPRHEARPHHLNNKLATPRDLVPTGTRFTQTITVDGITEEGLRSLLAAIDPYRILQRLGADAAGRTYATHLGGGKPFGLGSAAAEVTSCVITSVAERYTSAAPTAFDWSSTTTEIAQLSQRAGRFLRACASLSRILDVDGLGEWRHHVSYPPAATWDEPGSRTFDQNYRYFAKNDGRRLETFTRDWRPLPVLPDDPASTFDPTLPVAVDQRRQPGRRPR